jgi:hypothetical protein
MDDLQSILARVLKKRGLNVHAGAAHLTHVAQQEIQRLLPNCADQLSVQSFSNGTLLIASGHSIAAQECQAAIPALQKAIFRACGVEPSEVRIVRQTAKA